MGLNVQILEREADLEAIRDPWDRLAVKMARPYAAPAWMLAWWRHVCPDHAALRAIAVSQGDRLLGIAPFWVADGERRHSHYDVLSSRLATPAPLLVDFERAEEVAPLLARALAGARPRPSLVRLEGRSSTHKQVTERLVRSWPGLRPEVQEARSVPMPMVSLAGRGYEEWLGQRKSKFRQEARRRRRRLDDAGARFRLAGPNDVERAIDAYVELHGARWRDRGGSTALPAGIRAMLADAATELLPRERLRMFLLEREERVIAVQVLVAAGVEVAGWSGGFDEREKGHSPSLQLVLHAIADAAGRGEERVNLGPGSQSYKDQLADDRDEMDVIKVIPRGLTYPRTKLQLASAKARAETLPRLLGGVRRRVSPR